MGKTAKNERTKITATLLNNIAVVLFATGFAAPVYNFLMLTSAEYGQLFSTMMQHPADTAERGLGLIMVLGTAYTVHIIARSMLSDLED
jgi:hypothetical protein